MTSFVHVQRIRHNILVLPASKPPLALAQKLRQQFRQRQVALAAMLLAAVVAAVLVVGQPDG